MFNKSFLVKNKDNFYHKKFGINNRGLAISGLVAYSSLPTAACGLGMLLLSSSLVPVTITATGASAVITTASVAVAASGIGLAILSGVLLISGITCLTYFGIKLHKNRKLSKNLFNAVNSGSFREVMNQLEEISNKRLIDRRDIFNNTRDENGNTLINAVLANSNLTTEEKKEIIGKMIDNGADPRERNASIDENGRNVVGGKNSFEFVKENIQNPEGKSELVAFLNDKYKEIQQTEINLRDMEINKLKKKLNRIIFFKKTRTKKILQQIAALEEQKKEYNTAATNEQTIKQDANTQTVNGIEAAASEIDNKNMTNKLSDISRASSKISTGTQVQTVVNINNDR